MNAPKIAALSVVAALTLVPLANAGGSYGAPKANIVETAMSAGSFTTLVTALKAAGLDEALAGRGPFTVFAPTDDAFKKLPAGTVEGLLKDIPKLKSILLYHVVAGEVMAKDVVTLDSAKTLQGTNVKIATKGAAVMVNDATVAKADIKASNGVIHVIDTVILPAN
ncbi:MAG: fasciclin domain-containing protein [Acidobacteriota bacterium]